MNRTHIYFLTWLACCLSFPAIAQPTQLTKSDTTALGLRYRQGSSHTIIRETYWDSLLADVQRSGDKHLEALSLLKLGTARKKAGNDLRALECFQKSYMITQETGNRSDMVLALYQLSYRYFVLNKIKTAIDHAFTGLKVAEALKDQFHTSKFYGVIGTSYFSTGDYTKALDFHRKSLEIYKSLGLDAETVGLLIDIGSDYLALKDTSQAISLYLEAKKFIPKLTFNDNISDIYLSVGAAYELLGQIDSAYVYFLKAHDAALRGSSKRKLISTLASLAHTYYRMNNTAGAKKLALEAFDLMKITEFKLQVPALALILRDIYLEEKNYKAALDAYTLYVSARDSLSDENLRRQTREKEFNYDLEKKENENKLLAQQNRLQLFVLSGLGVVLLLVLIIAYLARRQFRFKAREQQAQLEQKLLRSQMSPHFIFNSLQAIQNFIAERGGKGAVEYLGSFARVMRNVLENSRLELIPLKQEMELLDNYLQLQKLRFQERFNYSISADKNLDVQEVLVPPMLTQPFIENAIEHGMHDVKSGGLIAISYTLHKERLQVEVTDNGYGFRYKGGTDHGHRSFALEVTRERIALLNKREKKTISFSVTEAFPDETQRKGVRVNFDFPLFY